MHLTLFLFVLGEFGGIHRPFFFSSPRSACRSDRTFFVFSFDVFSFLLLLFINTCSSLINFFFFFFSFFALVIYFRTMNVGLSHLESLLLLLVVTMMIICYLYRTTPRIGCVLFVYKRLFCFLSNCASIRSKTTTEPSSTSPILSPPRESFLLVYLSAYTYLHMSYLCTLFLPLYTGCFLFTLVFVLSSCAVIKRKVRDKKIGKD